MAWPYDARLTNFSAGAQVPSNTLNEMQDATVDLYRTHYLYASTYTIQSGTIGTTSFGHGVVDLTTSPTIIDYWFGSVRTGCQITAVSFIWSNSANESTALAWDFRRWTSNYSTAVTSDNSQQAGTESDTTTGPRAIVITLSPSVIVGDGVVYHLAVTARDNDYLYTPRLTITRPCTIT